MKPARFILNSDYTTVRNTGEYTMSLTIPNSITAPAGDGMYVIGQDAIDIGSSTNTFMIYFTSSAFSYSTLGRFGGTKPSGASTTYVGTDYISFNVLVNGSTATFKVQCNKDSDNSTTWTGYGQTITAHILTFKDPFSE